MDMDICSLGFHGMSSTKEEGMLASGGGAGATWFKPMPVPAMPPGAAVGARVPPLLTKRIEDLCRLHDC